MVDISTPLQRLQRIILSWDYWELVRKSEEGAGPIEKLGNVPSTFADIQDYKAVFEPLLLEECCAQVLRGVEEGEVLAPHPCVSSKADVKDDFLYARLVLQRGESERYGDSDLVLLCKENPMEDDANVSTAVKELHALGVCEGKEGEQSVRVKFRLSDDSQSTNPAGLARVRAMRAGLEVQGSCWWLLKLSNMSTIGREWTALQNAHMCSFMDILMSCKPRSAHVSRHMDIPPGMSTTMEAQCNASQMEALRAGLDGSPLVLIQGPPGTGKTRTILNLLSVIMHAASKNALDILKDTVDGRVSSSGGSSAVPAVEQEDRLALWAAQAPWIQGQSTERDSIKPYDPPPKDHGLADDCWGLLRTSPPLRLGKHAGPKAHVLVCAPSNSALDEIVLRIMRSGLMDKDGNMYMPSVVRIGVNVHHSVRAVSLDAIVDARLGIEGEGGGRPGTGSVATRVERDRMRLAILEEASVVCSTLSFAGSAVFSRLTRKFDVVVVDEAAQAVEPSTLVPLIMQGCKQVYLVGDPVQLPATVISTRALDHGYDCSLFKRLQTGGYPVKMLNVQYRMHPHISVFPSKQFYNGGLLDGETVASDTSKPWHAFKCFGPLAFFDVAGKESIPQNGASIQNMSEANMVLCVFRELVHKFPALRQSASVAVISPYKAQVKLIRDSFKTALGEEAAKMIDVNTIDGFQGREKDVCIFSCVRSLKKGKRSIGFVADERRINVGLTRARCSLIVIGNARALQANAHWAALIHHAMSQGCFFRPKAPFNQWMSEAAADKVQPITPSAKELAVLDKARSMLSGHSLDGPVAEAEGAALSSELHEEALEAEDEGGLAAVAGQAASTTATSAPKFAAASNGTIKQEAGAAAAAAAAQPESAGTIPPSDAPASQVSVKVEPAADQADDAQADGTGSAKRRVDQAEAQATKRTRT